jgi:hypothetical protein
MKLTYTIKQRKQLMEIERKLCDKFNKDNLKLKLYTTFNLWERAPLPSL